VRRYDLFQSKERAAVAARQALTVDPENTVIWDTETTGLDGHRGGFVDIAAVNLRGEVVFDSLIRPQYPVGAKALEIHGLSNLELVNAPTLEQVIAPLRRVLHGKYWIGYNIAFDAGYLAEQVRRIGCAPITAAWQTCAMHIYAEFFGEWSGYHGSFTWQKLTEACEQEHLEVTAPAHRALGDCLRTLALMHKVSAWLDL